MTSLPSARFFCPGAWTLVAITVLLFLIEAHSSRLALARPAEKGDQGAYLRYAREMQESRYAVVGDRNRMPVYPFLLSLLYRPGLSESDFLARAQAFNVTLSAAILLALFFIYTRHFPTVYAAALVAITAFGVFMHRAIFAQTEVLYYFVSFCAFLGFWRMFVAPGWWLALGTGLITGLAHLTKASVLPALVLFALTFGAKILWDIRSGGGASRQAGRNALVLALLLVSFLAVIFPYIQTSKRVFGRYFYNVNSTFYMWCDSWPEAKAFSRASDDRVGWPALPPEQIPSPGKYWREHSLGQIAARLGHGLVEIGTHNARLDRYYKYILFLAGTAAVLGVRKREEVRRLLRSHFFLIGFVALFFGSYAVLYAWYVPLSSDSRFVLALFLPFTFVTSKVVARLAADAVLPIFAAVLLVCAAGDAVHAAVRIKIQSAGSVAAATS